MAQELVAGVSGELEWTVDEQLCVRRGANDVFSTPSMVRLVEATSVRALEPYLQANQGSVGTRVDIRHLAPTPKGMRVRAIATVKDIDRRRVSFHVEVNDEMEKVGEAEHERFIVDLGRFGGRLDEKLKLLQGRP